MATTEYGVNHPLAVKKWSSMLTREVLKEAFATRFMGTSKNSLLYVKDELAKGAGDQVTYGLKMQLTGTGIQGDGTLEGNEEALTVHNDALLINQIRHAVRSQGKMSEKRVPFSVREEARDSLVDWGTRIVDESFFYQLAGVNPGNTIQSGNNAVSASTNNVFGGNQDTSTTNSLSVSLTGNSLILPNIDACVELAKTQTPRINPIRTNGGEYYVLFVHPYQATDLRRNAGTLGWATIQSYRIQGGEMDNPIFKGGSMLGIYNGVVIHESTRVPLAPSTTRVRKAVFCGAQAACVAFGGGNGANKFSWYEELNSSGLHGLATVH